VNSPLKRVILKLSGECFASDETILYISQEIDESRSLGVELSIVVGGGNFLRGRNARKDLISRVDADAIGMLGTVINGLRLAAALDASSLPAIHFAQIGIPGVVEPFALGPAQEAMLQKKILILSGGTGHPFFSTDTAAALWGLKLSCQLLLKGTRVDGIYTADPEQDPKAKRYSRLTFREALEKGLSAMDRTAYSLCWQEGLPVVVFNIYKKGDLRRVLSGEMLGTRVEG
jgi:uridylate kinase